MRVVISTFFFFLLFPFAAVSDIRLTVVTESSPPYHFLDSTGNVTGSVTKKVKTLLDLAGVKADIQIYPWARAYKMVLDSSHTLIFSMAVTPERKNNFHWIAEVAEFELAVVGKKDKNVANLPTIGSVFQGKTFAVQRDDIAYHWLINKGLREGKELLVCADIQCSWNYLLRDVVDYIIEDPALISHTAKIMNADPDLIEVVAPIPELSVTGYLAGNEALDSAVVTRLKSAAQQLGMAVTFDDGLAVQR